MGYQTLSSQQADLTVPANAMTNQASIGKELTTNFWDQEMQKRKLAESKRQFDEDLKLRWKEYERLVKEGKTKEADDMWKSILGVVGTIGGAFLGGPAGATLGGTLGSTLGGSLDSTMSERKPLSYSLGASGYGY